MASEYVDRKNTNDIHISEIIGEVINKKYVILITTLCFSILSLFFAIHSDDVYKSQALTSVQNTSESTSSLAQYGDLASLAGISLPSGSSDKTFLAIETIKSRSFFKYLMDKYNLLPEILAVDYYDKNTNKIVFKETIYNYELKKWTLDKGVPPYLEAHKFFLSSILEIQRSKETGFISISIFHESPVFAQSFLSLILLEVNNLAKANDIEEAKKGLSYLNIELKKTSVSEIKNSINALIETLLKNQMTASIKEEYLLKAIDPAYFPHEKFKPFRALICVLGTFFGLLISLLYVITNIIIRSNLNKKL